MRGADKLAEVVRGEPLLRRAVSAARAAAVEVVVTVPPGSPRRAFVEGARVVEVDGPMSASLRAGVAAVEGDAALVHLADMPDVGAPEMRTLVEAWRRSHALVLRAVAQDGTPGQPVIFSRALFPELDALAGDRGARSVIARHGWEAVPLPGRAALVDLDTPEDWAAWRAARAPS